MDAYIIILFYVLLWNDDNLEFGIWIAYNLLNNQYEFLEHGMLRVTLLSSSNPQLHIDFPGDFPYLADPNIKRDLFRNLSNHNGHSSYHT